MTVTRPAHVATRATRWLLDLVNPAPMVRLLMRPTSVPYDGCCKTGDCAAQDADSEFFLLCVMDLHRLRSGGADKGAFALAEPV